MRRAVGLYLTANSNVAIESLVVLTMDADSNTVRSPSISDMSVSHVNCTLQPGVPRLHTLVVIDTDLISRSTIPDSVKQAVIPASYQASRYTT